MSYWARLGDAVAGLEATGIDNIWIPRDARRQVHGATGTTPTSSMIYASSLKKGERLPSGDLKRS